MRRLICIAFAAWLSGCGGPTVPPDAALAITPPDQSGAAVVRRPIPDAASAAAPSASSSTGATSPPVIALARPPGPGATTPRIDVPAGRLYVCLTDVAGEQRQVGIEFAPKVQSLCERHPEMGPCQYERDICRRSGGRVYAAGGQEITLRDEAEYDRKVMRFRFKAN
ncbi:MAG: hypothetical protein ABI624_23190 [Casimicrobiaceae bacterium]